jgi:hypothetical protein
MAEPITVEMGADYRARHRWRGVADVAPRVSGVHRRWEAELSECAMQGQLCRGGGYRAKAMHFDGATKLYNTGFADASKGQVGGGTRRLLVLTSPGSACPAATAPPAAKGTGAGARPGDQPPGRQRPRPAGIPARWCAERRVRYPGSPRGSRNASSQAGANGGAHRRLALAVGPRGQPCGSDHQCWCAEVAEGWPHLGGLNLST